MKAEAIGQLPGWVRWLAQDEDGSWWAFEVEPIQFERGWYENEVGRRLAITKDPANKNWRSTLVSWP